MNPHLIASLLFLTLVGLVLNYTIFWLYKFPETDHPAIFQKSLLTLGCSLICGLITGLVLWTIFSQLTVIASLTLGLLPFIVSWICVLITTFLVEKISLHPAVVSAFNSKSHPKGEK